MGIKIMRAVKQFKSHNLVLVQTCGLQKKSVFSLSDIWSDGPAIFKPNEVNQLAPASEWKLSETLEKR